jgi:ATP adenylyltransferase
MDACNLCLESSSGAVGQPWNDPLFETENFVALPSIGALVEGWLLLVPKLHLISLGALPDSVLTEMQEFKTHLSSVLAACYGTVSAFEHGPSAVRRAVGCSVDHAHLHLVPVPFNLSAEVGPLLPKGINWTPAGIGECKAAYGRGDDYLYLEQPLGSGCIATHEGFGSQLFRRAVASGIGMPDQYNWREYEHVPTVMATIRTIRAWKESVAPRVSNVAA